MRQKPKRVETVKAMVPRYFYEVHRLVTLTADVMFVNGVPFLVTLSRKLRLFTVEYLPSRTAAQLSNYLAKVCKLYARGGFTISTVLMDQEFDKVAERMPMIEVNTTAAREHVGEIERGIRLIKERCHATRSLMSFQKIPKAFVIHLVYFCVMWMNSFPARQGISKKLSPREIVMQRSLDFETHAKGLYGAYVEASEDAVVTNTNRARTFAGILLGPTGNIQGTQKVFDVSTGAIKKCRTLRMLPMPNSIIKAVHDWAKKSAREEHKNKMVFLNRSCYIAGTTMN